jgi:hypothetical protein
VVFKKIFLVAVMIVALMVVAQDQRWGERAGIVGTCAATAPPRSSPGGYWYACKQGLMNGYPNLEADTCSSAGIVQHRQIWNCERPPASLPRA